MYIDFYLLKGNGSSLNQYEIIHCCSVKTSRFFASLRMTYYYILFVGDEAGWRRSRQPTSSPKHKTLIVISNAVRIENRR